MAFAIFLGNPAGITAEIKKVSGVTTATVKKIGGVTKANIKKVGGKTL